MSITYEHIFKDGHKVQVDSSIRDGNGVKIDAHYIQGEDVVSTTDVTPLDNYYTKAQTYSKTETDTLLNNYYTKTQSDSKYSQDYSGYLDNMNTVVKTNSRYVYSDTTINQPNNELYYGIVEYIYGGLGENNFWVRQFVYPNSETGNDYYYMRLYVKNQYEDGWGSWKKISTMTMETTLWQGNSGGNYTIQDISKFKYILFMFKESDGNEWNTQMIPSQFIVDEISSQGSMTISTQLNNSDTNKYGNLKFNSNTNIDVWSTNMSYFYLKGIS